MDLVHSLSGSICSWASLGMNTLRLLPQPRPLAVKYACALLATSYVLGAAQSVYRPWHSPTTRIITLAFLAAFMSFLVFSVFKRRNWARLFVVLSTLLGLAALPWSIDGFGTSVFFSVYFAQVVLQSAAAFLLISPGAARWYVPPADA